MNDSQDEILLAEFTAFFIKENSGWGFRLSLYCRHQLLYFGGNGRNVLHRRYLECLDFRFDCFDSLDQVLQFFLASH